MSLSHSDLCFEWVAGTRPSRSAGNMFYEGPTIYSWGAHWPLARKILVGNEPITLVNHDRYSTSTSQHLRHVTDALRGPQVRVCKDHILELGRSVTCLSPEVLCRMVEARKQKEHDMETAMRNNRTDELAADFSKNELVFKELSQHLRAFYDKDSSIKFLLRPACNRRIPRTASVVLAMYEAAERRLLDRKVKAKDRIREFEPLIRNILEKIKSPKFTFETLLGNAEWASAGSTEMGVDVLLDIAVRINAQQMAENHARVANYGVLGAGRNIAIEKHNHEIACKP